MPSPIAAAAVQSKLPTLVNAKLVTNHPCYHCCKTICMKTIFILERKVKNKQGPGRIHVQRQLLMSPVDLSNPFVNAQLISI